MIDVTALKTAQTANKNALDALLTYANEATQAGDTDIGEAIRTLVDGYGKGGGLDAEWPTGKIVDIIPETDTATITVDTGLEYAPHIVSVTALNLPSNPAGLRFLASALTLAYNTAGKNVAYTSNAINAVDTNGTIDYWSNAFSGSFADGSLTITAGRTILFAGGVKYRVFLAKNRNEFSF